MEKQGTCKTDVRNSVIPTELEREFHFGEAKMCRKLVRQVPCSIARV